MSSHTKPQPWTKLEILLSLTTLLLTATTLVSFLRPASHHTPRIHAAKPDPHAHSHSLPSTTNMTAPPVAWSVERPKVILFGDSLTERSLGLGGWGSSLAHTYYRRVDVINRGFGGYNTDWALHLMDEIFRGCSDNNTLLVTLFFGANDAAIPKPDGTDHSARQHIPLAQYRGNMKRIISDLKERGLQRLLLITPPPVYEPARKEAQRQRLGPEAESLPLDRTNVYTKQYALACQEVAVEAGLPVVDLWSSMQVDKDWGTKLFCDGLHFTVEGNQHAYEAVQRAINETYPSLRVEALPLQFPPWDMVDPNDPAASLKQPQP